jgi:hypothetical protein
MYAPKLQPLSKDERWRLGFEHRIDAMANAAQEEIKDAAYKARLALGLLDIKRSDDGRYVNAATIVGWCPSGTSITIQTSMQDIRNQLERIGWVIGVRNGISL